MNSTTFEKFHRCALVATFSFVLLLLATGSAMAGSITLEGQNKGNTNIWSAGNLQNWLELDYIPSRVHFDAGSAGTQTITVNFEHRNGGVPGIEDLTSFTTSSNAVFTSGPTLSAPISSSSWSYTFTVNITGSQPADVFFFSRLAAGAHLNVGSSLGLSGSPSSMGSLQIHKPSAGPGAPDLAVVKSGPVTIPQGGTITYTMTYTNKAATNTAVGSQIIDILPSQVTVDTNSLPANAHLVGNTLSFDLTNVAAHAKGQVTFQASVGMATPVGTVITNYSQILSSENDASYGDNTSTWLTTVTLGCSTPSVTTNPASATLCPGDSATLSVVASGTSPLIYRWRKGGSLISGATNSTYSIASVSTGDAGSYDVVVSNLCGIATSAAATLTVNDPVSAVGPMSQTNCSGDTAVFSTVASGTGPYSYQWLKDGNALDGETAASLTLSNVTVADSTTYSVIVSGACGSVTNSANLTVNAAPMITCAGNKNVELGDDWTFDAPTANYPITLVGTTTNTAGFCGNTFSATRTWTGTDACSNAASCSQTVTVVDTTAPVITCATNKIVQLGSAWSFDPPTFTDNGGTNVTITVTGTTTNTAGFCGNTFSATRTWTGTDACSNAASCSQTVTVVDTTAPVITCATNKIVQLGSAWSFDPPTFTDNGGTNVTITVTGTTTNTAGFCGNTFSATRTWTGTDACSNAAACSQTVTVVDTTAPVITCATNKIVQLGSAWSFDPPTFTDNGGTNVTITVTGTTTNTAGFCGNTFSATRTWTGTDACSNAAACSQTVTVVDTTAPVITCATNKIVQLGSAWSFDPPTFTDNGGTNVTITVTGTTTNTAGFCGNTFSATRTWTGTDACSNAAACSQTVTVVDTTAPVITCATNKIVQLGSAWSFDPPTFTDNGGTNVTITVTGTTTNTAGFCGNTFSATRTWTGTDACSNAASCSQTVTVVDTTAPVITCATNKIVQLGSAWSFDPPTFTDNGGTNVTITVTGTTTNTAGFCGNTFSATRTWTGTDACSNAASCSQTVTVVDTTAPVITCATNKIVQLGSAWSFDPPTFTDNGGTNVTITVTGTTTNTAGFCGNTFSATRTWTGTDACSNAASCSQTVTVVDTTAPVITCATNKIVQLGSAWSFDPPTFTDNGGTNVTITVTGTTTNTAGFCGNTFSATRTWTGTDACSNSAACSQTVTVIDTTAPVITCATNKIVQLGSAWSFDPPTFTDNGGTNVTITVTGTTTNTAGFCGNTFSATRTWTGTDACSNAASCSQTVTVIDTTAPVITCATNKIVQLGSAWSFDPPTFTDNGGTNVTITVTGTTTNTAGFCGNTFSATRTWTGTDACSNAAACSQTVTVVDTTAPVITCATNKIVQLGSAWSFDPPTFTDNGGTNVTITVTGTTTNTAGFCGNTFSATRTWTGTDACSNAASCSQTVTVVDTTAPVITCATNKIVQLGSAWSFDPPTFTDNGGTNVTITVTGTTTNTAGFCGNTFSATRTWTGTDACSNAASCSQTVTVVDTTAPVITCATNKIVQLGSAWSFDPPTFTDNGGTNVTITVTGTTTNTAGFCGNTFSATRTWTGTDACSNSAACSQTVTVIDTTAPVITCATNKIVQLGSAWSFDPPTFTDNGGTNVTITVTGTTTNTAGFCGNTFSATRTWMGTDACSNSAACSQTVTVIDTTAPAVSGPNSQTVCPSTTATFIVATIEGGLSYQWYKGASVLNSQTSSTLTLNDVQSTNAGVYAVVVSDGCGNATTNSATLTVNAALASTALTNAVKCPGESVMFNTTPSGTGPFHFVWRKDGVKVPNLDASLLILGGVKASDAGIYSVEVSGACGSVTNSAMLTVNTNVSASSLANLVRCPGESATFSTVASGTGPFSYAWRKNGAILADKIGSSLTLAAVTSSDAGSYSVEVSGVCGRVTNSASLTINTNVSATALASQIKNPGESATFSTTATGSGPLTYVWKKDGVVIANQTGNSLTLNSVTANNAGTYSVEVTGACNTVTSSAALVVNLPPIVSIIEPTNSSTFIVGQHILIKADAFDQEQAGLPLAAVTNVEFFANTTKLGEVTGLFLGDNLFSLVWSNATAGDYQLWARATDNMGLSATSSVVVNVRVLNGPDMTVVDAIHFNPQTSLYEETVRICNQTPYDFASVGIEIQNLRTNEKVAFYSYLTNNGNPVVVYNQTVAAGSCVEMLIRYAVKNPPVVLNVTLVPFATMPTPTVGGTSVGGVGTRVKHALFLPNSTFLLSFDTVAGAVYHVQYSSDLINWSTSVETVNGSGNSVQWIDYGPPATDSMPKSRVSRFYRVIRVQ